METDSFFYQQGIQKVILRRLLEQNHTCSLGRTKWMPHFRNTIDHYSRFEKVPVKSKHRTSKGFVFRPSPQRLELMMCIVLKRNILEDVVEMVSTHENGHEESGDERPFQCDHNSSFLATRKQSSMKRGFCWGWSFVDSSGKWFRRIGALSPRIICRELIMSV